jgi:hypothetical protein
MRVTRSVIWTAAGLALSALPARAIDEPPRPPASALGKIRDLATAVRARRALQEEPALSALNLGVRVENGVATVWGPVPSLDVGRRAVARLEALKGVTKVQPNFYVQERRDGTLDIARADGAPERIEAAKPEIETGKLPVTTATVVGRRDNATNGGPSLFAPRPAKSARPEPQGDAGKSPGSLDAGVRLAQQSEKRFKRIPVEVRGGTLLVRRGKSPGDDVMDLVQKLRRLPGVREVILAD